LPLAAEIADLAALAAEEVRRITGLDRALVYRFDTDWHGEVIAEDRNEMLPSYLGLRFPASDIPQPARELYRRNRLRLIADTDCTPAALVPALRGDEAPLDLSLSVLRGVSPTHLEYMRNMRTRASMSIALLRGGELWGLIACHHAAPSRVPYHVRNACDFIGQVLSLQIAAKEDAALAEHRAALQQVQTRLLAHMAAADQFLDGLLAHPDDLLALTGAAGAAVVFDDQCRLVGATPAKAEVMALADWLKTKARRDVFVTEALAAVMPGGEAFKDQASGVLAIAISQIHGSFLIWFRPEIVSTVAWGGEPRKVNAGPDKRIQPRASFATWRETVRLRARPWSPAEISAAADLRTAIVDIVLRKAEELAALSERLTTTNRELEAFSYSVSHDLRAPFRHIVGYAQLLKKLEAEHLSDKGNRYIDTIVDSAIAAGTLVDNLLSFSQMGRAALRIVSVDVGELVADVRRRLAADCAGRTVEWRIAPLPNAKADPTMLRLVFQNLLENAVKFTRGREVAVIEVGFGEVAADDGTTVGAYFVRDNGTGFDMAYVGKLFGVFQRLHRVEEFEGTGIGLANVHRIVERHDGRVWADAKVDQGATFFFTLPPKD
jgi:light-regulated signal transduction histidine kinase (bacteriophytochrome)